MSGQTAVREAIIYVPGSDDGVVDQVIGTVARRFTTAIDHASTTAGSTFTQTQHREHCGTDLEVDVVAIERADPGGTSSTVLDVYFLEYRDLLNGGLEQRGILGRTVAVLAMLLRNAWQLARGLVVTGAKTRRERLQIFVALLLMVLFASYLLGTVVALPPLLVRLTSELLAGSETSPFRPVLQWAKEHAQSLAAANAVVVVYAAGHTFVPGKVRDDIGRLAGKYYALFGYLTRGQNREAARTRFAHVIEHVAEVELYEKVTIVAYSFGGIITLDSLFPVAAPAPKRFDIVSAIVTVGVPFDFIRTFWPAYFAGRHGESAPRWRWINVFASGDVFASNFRDDDAVDTATRGLETKDTSATGTIRPTDNVAYDVAGTSLGIVTSFLFGGFAMHSMYWERDLPTNAGCFSEVVTRLYSGTPMLR